MELRAWFMSKIDEITVEKQKKPVKHGFKAARSLFMGPPIDSLFTAHICLLIKIYT